MQIAVCERGSFDEGSAKVGPGEREAGQISVCESGPSERQTQRFFIVMPGQAGRLRRRGRLYDVGADQMRAGLIVGLAL